MRMCGEECDQFLCDDCQCVNTTATSVIKCDGVIQCDDGSVVSGEKVAKHSVLGRYYRIVEGI